MGRRVDRRHHRRHLADMAAMTSSLRSAGMASVPAAATHLYYAYPIAQAGPD
jgi:hypothetical protein